MYPLINFRSNKYMFKPLLAFSMELPTSPYYAGLRYGTLLIKDDESSAGIKCRATSGCTGNQYLNSWRLKGKGCIPPSKFDIHYTVTTNRLWLPNVKGVEGSFYAISPFSVNINGVSRGDFGIHFDANVPGSAGCIVLPNQEHWDTFRSKMQGYRDKGIQSVPLLVEYGIG